MTMKKAKIAVLVSGGGTNLQAISDTHGKGASFWKLCFCGILGLCGTGKTQTDHYWVCQDCGNKFKM